MSRVLEERWELLNHQYPTALAMRDTEGRLLGEGNAPATSQEADVEWRQSRYPGSRHLHAKRINLSALRQMRSHYDALLSYIAFLRAGLRQRYPGEGSLTIREMWRFSRCAVTLPNYLVARGIAGPDSIPADVSVGFKSIAGVFIVTADLFLKEVDLSSVLTAEQVIGHADANGLFEGSSGVCAAPPNLMLEVIEAVVEGRPGGGPGAHSHIDDPERFFRYGTLFTQMEFLKQYTRLHMDAITARLLTAVPNAPEDERALRLHGEVPAWAPYPTLKRFLDDHPWRSALTSALRHEIGTLTWWGGEPAPTFDVPRQEVTAQVRHFLGLRPDDATGEAFAHALASAIDLEMSALARFASVQNQIDSVVERPSSEASLTHEELSRAMGPTISQRFASILGARAEYTVDSFSIATGP